MRTPRLALGFDRFFLLGFFFLFLGFVFVANELEDGYLGVVADAVAGVDDSGVAAGAVGKLRRDFAEEFLRDGGQHDVGSRLAPRLQRVALAKRDHFFRYGTRGFRTSQSRGDAPVIE